jgi:hypothetical protein
VALNPSTGEFFALILPDMTIESFQSFLDELTGFIGEQSRICLITDGAAAQRTIKVRRAIDLRTSARLLAEVESGRAAFQRIAGGIEESSI